MGTVVNGIRSEWDSFRHNKLHLVITLPAGIQEILLIGGSSLSRLCKAGFFPFFPNLFYIC